MKCLLLFILFLWFFNVFKYFKIVFPSFIIIKQIIWWSYTRSAHCAPWHCIITQMEALFQPPSHRNCPCPPRKWFLWIIKCLLCCNLRLFLIRLFYEFLILTREGNSRLYVMVYLGIYPPTLAWLPLNWRNT